MPRSLRPFLCLLGLMISIYIFTSSNPKSQKIISNVRNITQRYDILKKLKIPSFLGSVCNVKEIDHFNPEIMKYMYDFGEHTCDTDNGLQMKVSSEGFQLLGNGIQSVHVRKIAHDDKEGFVYGNFAHLSGLKKAVLSKNFKGSMRNNAQRLCIAPSDHNKASPPAEIPIVYSNRCTSPDCVFVITPDGHIKHNLNGRCIGPKGGSSQPNSNTLLVLSLNCNATFEVLDRGMIKLVGTSLCIHPLGSSVGEGKQLCLWPACDDELRLQYQGIVFPENGEVDAKKPLKLSGEMNQLEVEFADGNLMYTNHLNFVPKPLPDVRSLDHPNVVVISIDRASAAHFKRKLTATTNLLSKMEVIEYIKHAAISSSATANFLATLTGKSGSSITDASLFSLAKKNSYATTLITDEPSYVSELPSKDKIDNNPLPFFHAVKKTVNGRKFCVNDKPIYNITFEYLSSFLNTYHSQPKLAVVLLSQICNGNINYLSYMDKSFKSLLQNIQSLTNTVVVVNTLMGSDVGILGRLDQGVHERKRPFLSIYVSNDIKGLYQLDPKRLTQLSTPLDLYLTLRHLIMQEEQNFDFGKSFLQSYKDRSCNDAAVDSMMCPCV